MRSPRVVLFFCLFLHFALRSDVFIYFYYGGVHEECVNSRRLASWALLQALCYAGHRREMPDMIGMMSESLRSPLQPRFEPVQRWKMAGPETRLRERPYHAENTCTRPITDVKQHRARLVVSWETRCEARVSFSFFVLVSLADGARKCSWRAQSTVPLSFKISRETKSESTRRRNTP